MFRRKDLRIHLEAISGGGGVRALRRGDIDVLVGPHDALKSDGSFAFEHLGDLQTSIVYAEETSARFEKRRRARRHYCISGCRA